MEKNTKLVDIEGIDSSTVQEMMKFIYTGKCSINDKGTDQKITSDLLVAAHRYQLDILVEMCGDKLVSTLNPDNALELLELGAMYEAKGLKRHALDMIVTNIKTIRGSDKWKECRKKSSDLFMDISEALADRFPS